MPDGLFFDILKLMKTLDPVSAVRHSLQRLSSDLEGTAIVAAVSGGADSIALLRILNALAGEFGFSVSAVTVNHGIRSGDTSSLDADFVQQVCASLVPVVPCYRLDVPPGAVSAEARTRGKGIEEAARYVRYRYIDSVAHDLGAPFIMTGHNRDDHLETILMRFFQGSSLAGLSGIREVRDRYVRPLLSVPASDIRRWLVLNQWQWREDETNQSRAYRRNSVRHDLVPVLDRVFPGWENSVARVGRIADEDEQCIRSSLAVGWQQTSGTLHCASFAFDALSVAHRRRLVYDGLSLLGVVNRVSSAAVDRLCRSGESMIVMNGLRWVRTDGRIKWSVDIVQKQKSGYLVSVFSPGLLELPFQTLSFEGDSAALYCADGPGPFVPPFIVRTRLPGDEILLEGGGRKQIKKLMNEWGVSESDREILPIIEKNGSICAVWGSPLGYPNRMSTSQGCYDE